MTFHRGMHQYDKDGRDLNIEGYIQKACDWVLPMVQGVIETTFVDVGCDYGYALHAMTPFFDRVVGLEPNKGNNVFDVEIRQQPLTKESLSDLELDGPSVVWLNHVLEHLDDPLGALRLLNTTKHVDAIFLATPDAIKGSDDFVYRKSHVSVYTKGWYTELAPNILTNFDLADISEECLRDDCHELWALYIRKPYAG